MINIERYPSNFVNSTKFSKEQKYKDFINNKYGECTVLGFPGYINRTDSETSKSPAALVECSCGKYFITNWYHLKNGRVNSCGHLNGNYKLDHTEAACNDLLSRYKRSARQRHLVFNLTYDQFRDITSSDCHYCGVSPSQERKCKNCQDNYIYNGIDRKDPKIGYVIENCIPCCWICNRAKSDLNYIDFKTYIERLVTFASSIKTSGKNGEDCEVNPVLTT